MHPRELIDQLRANGMDPTWWRHVAGPFALRVGVLQPYYRYLSPIKSDDFIDGSWDNLVILDGCRYDTFRSTYRGPGTLTSRISPGSNTPEFLQETFGNRTLDDAVYVTGNPQVQLHAADRFHAVEHVWQDEWDDELETVPPDAMVAATLAAYETYPDKRLISHFVQPHYPFIGEYGRRHLHDQVGLSLSRELAADADRPTEHDHIWLRLRRGEVDESTVRAAYQENLEVALAHVETLLERFAEPTVITSDHGNCFGRRVGPLGMRIWGHPPGVHVPELVRVPWLHIPGTRRKQVRSEATRELATGDTHVAEERLKQLGYVT